MSCLSPSFPFSTWDALPHPNKYQSEPSSHPPPTLGNPFVLWICARIEHHPCSLGCNKSLQHHTRAEQRLGNLLGAVCVFWTALLVSLAVLLLLGCHSVLAFLSHTNSSTRAVHRVLTGTWSSFQQPPIIQRMCCCCRASLSTSQDLCSLGRNLPP